MNLEFSYHIFEKYSNIRFCDNPSSGRKDVPCGRIDGQTDMARLVDALCNLRTPLKQFQRIHLLNKTVDIFILFVIWYVTFNTNNNSVQSSTTIVFINTAA